ncbi:MAG: hypothetical protein HQL05_01780 [Nitrospirae bacterium]|uniref:hypothetical protein n=1 Tax=Candidatus Magnetobacterium casense TaxID=1455061 RepID=UPI0012DFB849|nr:hypothetical protein [Candidatus Magnetobacterium casensis]MBF0336539.1 hypothetical protein [Nitrospirota bacterium]
MDEKIEEMSVGVGLQRSRDDNCSSWAIKTLVKSKENDCFITCDHPKRLKYVEKAIWGYRTTQG